MTIYVVSKGCYSDRHIVGLFSTKERAEEYRILEDADEIEEWELDPTLPVHPPGLLPWAVAMKANGDTSATFRMSAEGFTPGWTSEWPWASGVHIAFHVWGRDEQHAIKIANEQRAMLLAMNRWPTDKQALDLEEPQWPKGQLRPLLEGHLEPPR